jgi:hypothetical protein
MISKSCLARLFSAISLKNLLGIQPAPLLGEARITHRFSVFKTTKKEVISITPCDSLLVKF